MEIVTETIEDSVIARPRAAQTEVAVARAAQEVQAAMIVAKRFPRDETAAFARVMKACKRKALAEQALYEYPRSGQKVTGPSIRLAEVLAQSWGNIDFGIVEVEQRHGESTMMAYAWDLETNTRQTKIFQVPHERRVGKGQNFHINQLSDPRDIYEMTANQGARRMRACILGIIPGDVCDAAMAECERTMKGDTTEPISDRARKMVAAFEEISVTAEMLEARLGHALSAISETELVNLRKVFTSIRDNMASRESFFPTTQPPDDGKSKADRVAESLREKSEEAPSSSQPEEKPAAEKKGKKTPEPAAEALGETTEEPTESTEGSQQTEEQGGLFK